MLSIPKISQRLMLNHRWESEVYSSPQNTKMLGCTSSKRTHSWGQKGKKKRRGKTRAWIRRRSSKGYYNIVKELMIEDTAGYKEMIRRNHGNIWIRWTLRVRVLNMLSVAVQMHSTLLSHAWMTAKTTKEMLSRVERKVWPVSNLTQQDSTPLNRVFKCAQLVELNMLRACTVDKSSAFARGLTLFAIC